ncbi:MAG: hypothetical protein EBS91_02800 [Betaproteobacteria bacterium]|nr:hypothetical protein [Betaproteobacteria bacterium]NCA23549.1 hypothetical protein [Betaproteobacteria bacterium]
MITHPSYEGLYHIFISKLAEDNVDPARAEEDAKQVCAALWKLSQTIRRSDIPKTVAFMVEQGGVVERLLSKSKDEEAA